MEKKEKLAFTDDYKKAEQEKIRNEAMEAQRLAKQSVKKRMKAWVESFELPEFAGSHVKFPENQQVVEIRTRFEQFKSWAMKAIIQS